MAWYFQKPPPMEHAVQPVHHEIGQHQEQHRLQPQRQRRQRAMAVVVERDQFVGVMDPEHQAGAEHQKPDPEHAREQRHQEPVARSVTSSRLRHHGRPGLQAQKCASTENSSASASVTGTTLAMVWPSISTISIGQRHVPSRVT